MRLSDLEVASGTVSGGCSHDLPPTALGGRQALEAVMLEAMRDRRGVVSFSGGRDSSTVLAIATHVARREGLPDPVPITTRFTDAPRSEEREWQELVVRHLGLSDWEVVESTDELDLLGDIATAALRRHGLLWPPNHYFYVPLLERSRGHVLLTGYDGDRLFDGWRYRSVVAGLGRRRPTLQDARTLASRFVPKELVVQRASRSTPSATWLADDVRRQLAQSAFSDRREPLDWRRRLRWLAGRRRTVVVTETLATLGEAFHVRVLHPLLAPLALAGLSNTGGRRGWPDRTSALRELVGDLLPDAVVARRSKAAFTEALVGEQMRTFAREWSGDGVPLVDPEALRHEWLSSSPVFQSMTALHAAWIHDQGRYSVRSA